MKFVDDLRLLPRKWSTRLAGIQITSVVGFWALVPAEWKSAVPNGFMFALVIFFGLTFVIAQAIHQPKLKRRRGEPPEQDTPQENEHV